MDAPKTLKQALIQGLRNREDYDQTVEKDAYDIKPHVLEFLKEKFMHIHELQHGALGGGRVQEQLAILWNDILGIEKP